MMKILSLDSCANIAGRCDACRFLLNSLRSKRSIPILCVVRKLYNRLLTLLGGMLIDFQQSKKFSNQLYCENPPKDQLITKIHRLQSYSSIAVRFSACRFLQEKLRSKLSLSYSRICQKRL